MPTVGVMLSSRCQHHDERDREIAEVKSDS